MKKPTSMLAILCATAATAALGGTYSWNVTTGGALDADANWTPSGVPGAADTATLRYAQSAPYTLDASMSVLAINVNANATLDLGAGKSFLAEGDSSNSKIQIAGNTTVQLLSGTFGIGDTGNRFFLGDTGDNARVVVSGANSILRSSFTSPIIVGQGKKNCSLLVNDGAQFHGCLSMGVSAEASTGHSAVFSGAGTRFISNNSHYTPTDWNSASVIIGLMGSYNELAISNNAEMIIGDRRSLSMSSKYGGNTTGGNNTFKVTHGGRASIDRIYAGNNGPSNKVIVCAGGDLSVSNFMYIGYKPSDNVTVLRDNSMLVTGEGSRFFIEGSDLIIGDKLCVNGLLEVKDGGLVECEASLRIGGESSVSNAVRVGNGGRFKLRNKGLQVGTSTAPNSVFEVSGGEFSYTNSSSTYQIDIIGQNSRFSLLNGARADISNAFVQVGTSSTSFTNALFEMRGGSVLSQAQPSSIDKRYYTRGVGASFVVDASTIDASGLFVCTGQNSANSLSNRLDFVNGSVVNLRRIVVGDFGYYCSMDVDDSTVNLSNLGLGYSAKDQTDLHTALRVRGANSKIRITNEMHPRNDTTFEFTIPAEGFLNQPVISCKSMETSLLTTPSLVVKRSAHHIDGGRIVLIKTNNVDIDMDAVRAHFAVSLPDGCDLDLSNPREIAVYVPSRRGTIVSFR